MTVDFKCLYCNISMLSFFLNHGIERKLCFINDSFVKHIYGKNNLSVDKFLCDGASMHITSSIDDCFAVINPVIMV